MTHRVRTGGYNWDYPATGQRQTGKVTFSNCTLCQAVPKLNVRATRGLNSYVANPWGKSPLEPAKHYESGACLARELPKSLRARR